MQAAKGKEKKKEKEKKKGKGAIKRKRKRKIGCKTNNSAASMPEVDDVNRHVHRRGGELRPVRRPLHARDAIAILTTPVNVDGGDGVDEWTMKRFTQ